MFSKTNHFFLLKWQLNEVHNLTPRPRHPPCDFFLVSTHKHQEQTLSSSNSWTKFGLLLRQMVLLTRLLGNEYMAPPLGMQAS